ncbi:hypothetical protein [Streptomyces klenkii]
MNSNLPARLVAAVGAAALVMGGAVIAAPAAQANGPACANYLAGSTPNRSTTDIHLGCAVGALNLPGGPAVCKTVLANVSQVSGARSDNACAQAGRP